MRRFAHLAMTGLLSLSVPTAIANSALAADLPQTVTGTASAGLIQIATTGNPEGLQRELGGRIEASTVIAERIGQATLDGLLDVGQGEHLAPKALIAPSGEVYAMVAPTITKDNFVLVTADGIARRMDVGASEETNEPFEVAAIDSQALPETVRGVASPGLIQIATTGNPEGLYGELGGEILESAIVAEVAGPMELDRLLEISKHEHLAPKALVAPSGEIYAMVAPTITKDNFILVTRDGHAQRMDVGDNEGTHRPFQVAQVVGDGGTPVYVEFWNWLTGR